MLLSRAADTILAIGCATYAAAAFFWLRPQFFDVLLALLGAEAEPHWVRRFLATVGMASSGLALLFMTAALRAPT